MKHLVFFVLCFFTISWMHAQGVVEGVVKAEGDGRVLPGATVAVTKGGTATSVTDLNGQFRLAVQSNSGTITVSYVGMQAQTVSYTVGTRLEINLDEAQSPMEEVVTIGYGTKRKEDLTTSVSTINLGEGIKSRPSNLSSMLQGQLPGVTIQSAGGDPLSGANINIRGMGSRSGDGILFVVDGVPNAPYNVEDIESIAVLKDAASAAIYGAYAGTGGVVMITTKKAAAGKVRVDANVSRGFQSAWRLPKVLTSEEFNKVVADAAAQDNRGIPFPAADPQRYPYGTVTRTDWLQEVFRTSNIDHYALSLSGGSDKMRGLFSVSYDKNNGILHNTYSDVLGAKTNLDFNIAPWLRFNQRASYQYTNGQGDINTQSHEGVLMYSVFYPRSATIYEHDKDGNPVYDQYGNPLFGGTIPRWAAAEGISGFGEIRNPYAILARLNQNRPSHNIFSTSTMEIKPLANLVLRSDFTVGIRSNRTEVFSPRVLEPGLITDDNSRALSSSLFNTYLWENTVNYSRTFDGGHQLSGMAGFTMGKDWYRGFNVQVNNFDRENLHFVTLETARDWSRTQGFSRESIWEDAAMSGLARLDYSFRNKYFLVGSARRDASSRIPSTNRARNFYGLSGSWKLSSENFFGNLRPYVNLFKIRGSWGQIGNKNSIPINAANVPMKRTSWPVFYGSQLQSEVYGIYQASIVNSNLIWENTEQSGVGVDMELFRSLTITVDYFNKITKDLIDELPVPSQGGVEIAPPGNVGKVSNKGWEFSARYDKRFGEIDWNLFANFTTLSSKVLALGTRTFLQHTDGVNAVQPLRSAVGQPWYSYYVLQTAGIFQTQDEVDAYTHKNANGQTSLIQPNAKPGDLKYVDFNNDGQINADDNQFMGSYMPKLTYAFGTGLKWRGIDFSAFFQGISGVKIFNGFKAMGLTGRQVPSNMLADVLQSWNYDKNSGIPKLGLLSDPNGNFTNPSDFMLENGSYLRLKNITLGYSIPKQLLSRIRIPDSNLRFYVNGENLLTITKYTGFDPEVGRMGLDGGRYPLSRVVSVGLNMNF